MKRESQTFYDEVLYSSDILLSPNGTRQCQLNVIEANGLLKLDGFLDPS